MSAKETASINKVEMIGNVVIAALSLVIFVGGYVTARGWPLAAGLFPIGITVTGAVLSALVLAFSIVRWVGARDVEAVFETGGAAGAASEPSEDTLMSEAEEEDYDLEYAFSSATGRQWLNALTWVTVYFLGLWLLGAFVITALVTFLYLKFEAKRSIVFAVIYAAILLGVMWASVEYMELSLPEGVLFSNS